MKKDFDVIVIGGGPGGYVAAIRAAQRGLSVALVEEKKLGGICLNWGCIPTKALLHAAELFQFAQQAQHFGLTMTVEKPLDLTLMHQASQKAVKTLSTGISHLMKKHKIALFKGRAYLPDLKKVIVSETLSLTYQHLIIATGARAKTLPHIKPDEKTILTYKGALSVPKLPSSLLVIGSGAIGMEFAWFFQTLGSEVTVVEALPRILPACDKEISDIARKSFEQQGITFYTNTTITELTPSICATLKGGKTLKADKALLAVGVKANVENLGLENLGLDITQGYIPTKDYGKTSVEGVYAIGDVTKPPCLAHKASHEGLLCADAIAGKAPASHTPPLIPDAIYTAPQIASIGLSQQEAEEKNIPLNIGRFPFTGNGKAIATNHSQGLVKTLFHKTTGELIGAHLIGAHVTELIGTIAVAMTLETTEEDFLHTVFPHPTFSEALPESILHAIGLPLHQ